MNSLRIRVVLLSPNYGVGTEFNYAIQVSEGGLVWWTINRFKSLDEALPVAKNFAEFVKQNRIIKDDKVLWSVTL